MVTGKKWLPLPTAANDTNWIPNLLSSNDIIWLQIVAGNFAWLQMASVGCKMPRMASNDFKASEKVTHVCTRLQMA